jgi:hypothetical protein
MRRRYHSSPRRRRAHGQVAVEPWWLGSDAVPHVTSHAAPTQFFTVQPIAGHVT